jgi:hypothetical protein
MRTAALGAILALAALTATGCGGASPAAPAPRATTPATTPDAATPAAAPAVSPRLTRRPAGRVLRVGTRPDAVGADTRNGRFALAVHDPTRLVLVSARSGRIVQRSAVPGGDPTPSVFWLQGATGRDTVAVADGRRPATAAFALGRTFVTVGDEVDALGPDGPTGHLTAPATAIAAADGATHLAVLSGPRHALELYDPRTLRRLDSTPAPPGATHLATLDDQVYVTDTTGNALLTYGTHPHLHRIERRPLPGAPYAIAIDPIRRILAVTLTASNRLIQIPLAHPTQTTTLPTIRQPDALAIDPSTATLAVASPTTGALQLIRSHR